MTLIPGVRLGHYEVLDLIGTGGMGEVYRARDTRLDRTVALKLLSPALASDPATRARFEREARAISALEHPNICTLHDVGESDGQSYLVMEHLAGENLDERLERGPLPLAQALEVGTQVAEALAAAHRKGVVHRDLKPGNVMLTRTGAKLLDFGLACLVAGGGAPVDVEQTSMPTEAAPLTGRGTIVGTLAYMAPEQLESQPVDARTDIWALGAVLYETIAGVPAFEGRSPASLVAAILERQPEPLQARQSLTPPALERLVKRCLAKSPDDRWDTAHDVAEELRWIAQAGPAAPVAPATAAGRGWKRAAGALGLVAAGAAAGVLAERAARPSAGPPATVVRSLLDVRPADELGSGGVAQAGLVTPGGSRTALGWTPDGRAVVFVGRRGGVSQLYVRELQRDEARALAGSEGARSLAVSPDGRWVAFWAGGAIQKVPLDGGPPSLLLGGVPDPPRGMALSAGGDVFFDGADGVIWRASAERGKAAVTKRLEGELLHCLPSLLPGERALLYTVRRRQWTWGDEEVVAQRLDTGERRTLLHDAADARPAPGGHLVFLRRGTLLATAFDAGRLEVRGSPVAVVERVRQSVTGSHGGDFTGAGHFSVSSAGALAWLDGPVQPYAERALVAVDRTGRVTPLTAPLRAYASTLDLSRDGRRLAVVTNDLAERALWSLDPARGTLDRLTPDGEAFWPRWTPDGRRVAFSWLSAGRQKLAWQDAAATSPPEVLAPDAPGMPSSWSPDGRQLAVVKGGDIWVTALEGSGASERPLTQTPYEERWPEFSPDGRWLAYASDVSGRFEVYVQPWPGPGPREQVSLEGGQSPAWGPDGRELFFLAPAGAGRMRMAVVGVRTRPSLEFGAARSLFEFAPAELGFSCVPARCYAVFPDGRRFLVTRQTAAAPAAPVTEIQLVLNWAEELMARFSAGPAR